MLSAAQAACLSCLCDGVLKLRNLCAGGLAWRLMCCYGNHPLGLPLPPIICSPAKCMIRALHSVSVKMHFI